MKTKEARNLLASETISDEYRQVLTRALRQGRKAVQALGCGSTNAVSRA
jgi:hypothetical protein